MILLGPAGFGGIMPRAGTAPDCRTVAGTATANPYSPSACTFTAR